MEDKAHDRELLQLVTFTAAGEKFGVDIARVQEIIRTVEITKVPSAPFFCEGIISLRGKVIPIISLRRRFGKPDKQKDSATRIIVVEIHKRVVGFVVDAVSEVLRIPASTVEPPPPVTAGIEAEYIAGVGKLEDRLLILLELEKLLACEELAALGAL